MLGQPDIHPIFSADDRVGTIGRTLCKSYRQMYVGPLDVRYFWNILWIILGRTRHPLDHCAKTTGFTLGLPDVRCSIRELVANFPYK